jgi:hypothetical protein
MLHGHGFPNSTVAALENDFHIKLGHVGYSSFPAYSSFQCGRALFQERLHALCGIVRDAQVQQV